MAYSITREQGCWIKYQLHLNRISQEEIAENANTSSQMVSQFLKGRKTSESVQLAMLKLLGYESMTQLLAGCVQKGGAA
jgi:transcriptional regulator with XRE-family HTH domain